MRQKTFLSVIPFLGLGLSALLIAFWSGLVRIGWNLPATPQLTISHGALILNGFLGVLIPLERAVALRRRWMFLAPLLNGVGWVVWFISPLVAKSLFLSASLIMVGILGVMLRRESQLHTVTMLLGGLSWMFGNLLWLLGNAVFQVVLFWIAFLVLTISGERLELNRVLKISDRDRNIFKGIVGVLSGAAILSLFQLDWGVRLSAVSYLCLFAWFLRKDIAFRNLRHPQPLTRFISIGLASGFIWLGLSGVLYLVVGKVVAGVYYDALLHALFVGFVGSMIFGHAPMIFPALFGLPARFSKVLYFPWLLLQFSLIARLIGDFTLWSDLRRWGGLFNILAALLYLAMTVRLYLKRGTDANCDSLVS